MPPRLRKSTSDDERPSAVPLGVPKRSRRRFSPTPKASPPPSSGPRRRLSPPPTAARARSSPQQVAPRQRRQQTATQLANLQVGNQFFRPPPPPPSLSDSDIRFVQAQDDVLPQLSRSSEEAEHQRAGRERNQADSDDREMVGNRGNTARRLDIRDGINREDVRIDEDELEEHEKYIAGVEQGLGSLRKLGARKWIVQGWDGDFTLSYRSHTRRAVMEGGRD